MKNYTSGTTLARSDSHRCEGAGSFQRSSKWRGRLLSAWALLALLLAGLRPCCAADPDKEYITLTYKNTTKNIASWATITLNKTVLDGVSVVNGPPLSINGTTIMFSKKGGINPGDTDTVVIVVPFKRDADGQPVVNQITSVVLTFPQPAPKVTLDVPQSAIKGAKKPDGLQGYVYLTNDDTNTVYYANVAVSKEVPDAFFGTNETQMIDLGTNDLEFDSGEVVVSSTNFVLAPGATATIFVGAVTETNYMDVTFDEGYTPAATNATMGFALVSLPMPPTLFVQPQSATSIAQSGLLLSLQGETNGSYAVDYSEDLINWIPLQTNEVTTNTLIPFVDPAPPTNGFRFYSGRLVIGP